MLEFAGVFWDVSFSRIASRMDAASGRVGGQEGVCETVPTEARGKTCRCEVVLVGCLTLSCFRMDALKQ